ncbi:hypothetical protein D4764_06G0012680 [Takifugu flavidus]|uniref:Uncharacterized protein n=1 Tax=Takifugu flavidus TaxID=433684 RepID=A0A5C6MZA5_9TELE|nr:hypothetical protein D4764_06G0012680 [Takifugu flavidus]
MTVHANNTAGGLDSHSDFSSLQTASKHNDVPDAALPPPESRGAPAVVTWLPQLGQVRPCGGFVKEGASASCTRRGRIPPGSLDSILFLHHNHTLATENGQTRRIERSWERIYNTLGF